MPKRLQLVRLVCRLWLCLMIAVVCLGIGWSLEGNQVLAVSTQALPPEVTNHDVVLVSHHLHVKPGELVAFQQHNRKNLSVGQLSVIDLTRAQATVQSNGTFSTVPLTSLVGGAEVVVPGIASLLRFIESWPGLVLCAYLPAGYMVIGELQRLRQYYAEPYKLK